MKFTISAVLLFLLFNSSGQSGDLIFKQELIQDYSSYPFYPKVVDDQGAYKSRFQFLDSIEVYGITYWSDGLKVNGVLVKPKVKGKYPCVIYNRGGNRKFGSLKMATAAIRLGKIASEGYVVIASQYRGNAGGDGQEEFGGADIDDVTILPKVLKEIEGADVSRIGMYGWSRGGMMTYLAMSRIDGLKAVITGGAPSDLTIRDREEMEQHVYAELIPGYAANRDSVLRLRSIVYQVEELPKNVPMLIMHGTSDWRVKPDQSLKLALELDKYRVPYRLVMIEGGDHGLTAYQEEVQRQVMSWLDRFLKREEAVPNMDFHGR